MARITYAAAAALAMLAAPAQALTTTTTTSAAVTAVGVDSFEYVITGWDDGGVVLGSFTGIDADLDGQLSSFDGEISGFVAVYTGGTAIANLLWGIGDLFGLVYDLDGGPLGDGLSLDIEGIGASNATHFFAIGPGPIGLCDTGDVCGVIETADVPAPGTRAMLATGFGLVSAGIRRRSLAAA